MKCHKFYLLLIAFAVAVPRVHAQTLSEEAERKARQMLREAIESREKSLKGSQTPAPIISTSPAPIPSTKPASPASQAPAPTVSPAPVTTPMTAVSAPVEPAGHTAGVHQPSYTEIEQQYLAGQITAKQFQKYLQDAKFPSSTAGPVRQEEPALQPQSPPSAVVSAEPTRGAAPSLGPTSTSPEPAVSPRQTEIDEVEQKMDELLRLKAAREQAASAAPAVAPAAAPKTQRERLNELLRLNIAGKLSDNEYKAQREKILAEPPEK